MMHKLFDLDNPLWSFLSKIANLIMLNVMFIACSIPIITIGASLTALYSITLKVARDEDVYILKGFLQAFKENFKQSTIIWIIMFLIGFILFLDFKMTYMLSDSLYKFMKFSLIIISIFYTLILLYIFAYISRFRVSTGFAFKNTVLISILNFPYTLFVVAFTIGVASIILWTPATLIWGIGFWILIGFSLTALVNSYVFKKVFSKYENSIV